MVRIPLWHDIGFPKCAFWERDGVRGHLQTSWERIARARLAGAERADDVRARHGQQQRAQYVFAHLAAMSMLDTVGFSLAGRKRMKKIREEIAAKEAGHHELGQPGMRNSDAWLSRAGRDAEPPQRDRARDGGQPEH